MCHLVWTVKSHYSFGLAELLRISPRFAILLVSMCLSVAFIVVDVLSVLGAFQIGLPTGINPFWKVSPVGPGGEPRAAYDALTGRAAFVRLQMPLRYGNT